MHLAVTREHASVEVEHWMSILTARGGPFEPLLRTLDIAPDRVGDDLAARLDRMRGAHRSAAPTLSRAMLEWLEESWLAASLRFARNEVLATDLLLALTTSPVLQRLVREIAPSLRLDDSKVLALATAASSSPPPASSGASAAPDASATTAASPAARADSDIARFTVDLTAAAREGKLDPVVGREAELRQVVDILMRRRQNNPILTGEAGVGKTAVVEALALRIAAGSVPPLLADVTILALDLGLLQAGAGVKGEFERRLTGLIAEIKASTRPIILFIDEAHLMIGAGNQSGGSDAANLLKPPLARGELRTIAATTWSEYKRHIERDPALTRRFQVVKVDEPKPEGAIRMLRGIVPSLEKHHGVRIKDEALAEAVRLSARHLPDRQLPDKAISVLDTAAAGVAISHATDPAAIEDLLAEVDHLATERAAIVRDEGDDMAGAVAAIDARAAEANAQLVSLRVRVKEERLLVDEIAQASTSPEGEDETARGARLDRRRKLEARLEALQGEAPLIHRRVDRDAVAAVVARWTGVPVGRLIRDAIVTARTLEDRLRQRVVGQDRALAVIASAMRTSAARLGDPRKPPGVFLMVGTSGIGKTETALALADQLFGGSQHLSIINMSEFKEEHKVSSLVGAPPGYVGYGEGGVLTEAVRRRPYGLLLMDEVEKAHPGVQDVFYQVFDKGMLRDGEGRDIEFLNTTIILTSNAGSETLAALAADPETMPEGDALVEALQPELSKVFKPAFLGRVTIVPYLPLSEPVLHDIFKLQIARIAERLMAAHGARLVVAPAVEDVIVARCLAGSIGARAIEGALSREILPAISDVILEHALGDGDVIAAIHVDLDDARRVSVRADLLHGTVNVPSEQATVRPVECDHHGDDERHGDLTPEPADLAQA